MYENSFIQKCLNGEADIFELDNYIEYWHTHDVGVSLRDYLGLTPSEYEEWESGRDSIFRDILRCRMEGISFENTPNKRERFARCNRCAYRAESPTGECHCMSKASSQYGKEVTDQTGCLVGEES